MPPLKSPTTIRQRIEDGLGAWAHTVDRYSRSIVVLTLLLTAGLASFIPQIEVKMASEDFLFEDDPVRATYDAFKEEFGQDQISTLAITPPEIFDLEFLERLRAFHKDLEDEVPFLEEVTSLANVRSTYGRGDELVVEDLLDDMPENAAELAAFKERVLGTPFYYKTGILSDDGLATSVRVEVAVYGAAPESGETGEPDAAETGEDDLGGFDNEEDDSDQANDLGGFDSAEAGGTEAASSDAEFGGGKRAFLSGVENAKLVDTIHRIIERHSGPDFPIHAAGGTMMTYEFTKALGRDVPLFFGGGLVVICFVLVLLFRRFSPVILCVAVVVPATLATFGLAAILKIPFSAPSQLIPSFLLSIGVSYSVHLVTIFLHDLSEGKARVESLEHALRHSGLPILMTAVTTSAGLLSFFAAEMKPIQEMGAISSMGVGVMVVYAMVFLPALLSLLPIKGRAERGPDRVDRLLGTLAATSARHPWQIIAIAGVVLLGAFAGMLQLHTSADPVSWFPEDHPYSMASDLLVERFGGTSAIELIIDTGRVNGLHEPEVMERLDSVEGLVKQLAADGANLSYTSSVADIMKETHKALNANDESFYAIPDERLLLAQEMLLFENSGSDDLEKIVDSQFSRARYTIRSKWTDGAEFRPFLDTFEPMIEEHLSDVGTVTFTGMSAVMARTVTAVTESMLRSYGLALCLITPLMILLIGSLRSGLVSMIPNLVPILLTLGMMGLIGIPIDMFTLLAGCIAIGLAVDDSIHFISGFRRYRALGHDPVRAVEETMRSTGKALLFTSIVLVSGFAVLLLSEMLNLRNVGILTSFAIAAAFLLDVTVTPALLVLTHRREIDQDLGATSAESTTA